MIEIGHRKITVNGSIYRRVFATSDWYLMMGNETLITDGRVVDSQLSAVLTGIEDLWNRFAAGVDDE